MTYYWLRRLNNDWRDLITSKAKQLLSKNAGVTVIYYGSCMWLNDDFLLYLFCCMRLKLKIAKGKKFILFAVGLTAFEIIENLCFHV